MSGTSSESLPPKESPAAPRDTRWWRKRRHQLTVLGTLFLFGSWATQNYLYSGWAERVSHLEQTQSIVAVEMGRMTQWLLQYHRSEAKADEASLLGMAAFKYIESAGELLGWATVQIDVDDGAAASPPPDWNAFVAEAAGAYQRNDLPRLQAMVRDLDARLQATVDPLTRRFVEELQEARERKARTDAWFLGCYILGSLAFVLSWFLRVRREDAGGD